MKIILAINYKKGIIQNEVKFWFNNRKIILVKSYFSSITKTKNKPKIRRKIKNFKKEMMKN